MAMVSTIYHIWLERNARIFQQKQQAAGFLIRQIIQVIHGRDIRVPDDYIDQIKLTILEIYVRKEPKTSQQCSPLSVDEHPQLENRNSIDGFPITQSTDFPNMTHYQKILIGRYDFDLNETINESDW
ncbi:hypothetical protein H5410_061882 [Solanum commersonii]|uniref:Uncharacterized protein n=1 Tax=Solanum commersonii TaxID=4109 RepID=A0A9J5WA22_SOLCO|nr:hypothetical protein H5410_061882 [Solanum commersonii]